MEPDFLQKIKDSFALAIEIRPGQEQEELFYELEKIKMIDTAVELLLSGQINSEELLEFVEPYLSTQLMDQYCEEVEENIKFSF